MSVRVELDDDRRVQSAPSVYAGGGHHRREIIDGGAGEYTEGAPAQPECVPERRKRKYREDVEQEDRRDRVANLELAGLNHGGHGSNRRRAAIPVPTPTSRRKVESIPSRRPRSRAARTPRRG